MNIPYVMKRCSKCGRWLVASTVNFYGNKGGKYRLESQCKECKKKYDKQWQQNNRSRKAKNNKQWHDKYGKQYYEAHKDEIAERQKRYYQDNRDKRREHNKQWYESNKEKKFEYNKQYRQSPQGQVVAFNNRQRRRTKEEQQGTGITKDQWLELMSFFDFRCAYSGKRLTKKTRSVDHIVPINSGGDNMIWNCVPMTRSLNSSKQDKDMLDWYREQSFYSEARLAKIYEWQEYARKKWKIS